MSEPALTSPSRAARCSRARSTCSTGSASTPPRSARTSAGCCSRTSGIVTMSPSDVPTYVEHGSADIGITGKDVLLEQSHARSTSCSTSATASARWSWRRPTAATRSATPCAASAASGSRPSTRAWPPSTSRPPGRQAEIVEVKGSVELAPLTGLVDGIVDLTATGKTLAENNLRVVETIATCTARLIANPVAHKLKAERDRLDRGAGARMKIDADATGRARSPPRAPSTSRSRRAIIGEVRAGGDAAVLELTERFDHAELGPDQLRVDPNELEASVGVLEPDVLEGCAPRSRTSEPSPGHRSRRARRRSSSREGHTVEVVEHPVRRAAVYVPAGRAPYPVDRRDGRRHRARGGAWRRSSSARRRDRAGRANPVILAACVLCEVNEVYRMGGAQAIAALAYGTESVRRR